MGTIAGVGDGINTYDGVAVGAKLYAIKVFAKGSTGDAVIIAALEYSADPNGDGNPDDRLDVINLSLGSGFGTPHALYSEAVNNITSAGTVAAISAGNSGDKDYIVGSPSTVSSAISVAASVDDMKHNWNFAASKINLNEGEPLVVKAIEGVQTN